MTFVTRGPTANKRPNKRVKLKLTPPSSIPLTCSIALFLKNKGNVNKIQFKTKLNEYEDKTKMVEMRHYWLPTSDNLFFFGQIPRGMAQRTEYNRSYMDPPSDGCYNRINIGSGISVILNLVPF